MCIGAPVVLRPLQQLHNTQQRGGCVVISYRMNLYEWFTLESSSFTSGMLSTASTSFFFCLTSPSVSVHPAISWDVKLRNPGQSRLVSNTLKVQMLEGCFRDRLLGIRTDPWQRLGPYEPSLRPQMKVSTRCVLDSSKLHQ